MFVYLIFLEKIQTDLPNKKQKQMLKFSFRKACGAFESFGKHFASNILSSPPPKKRDKNAL